MKAPRAGFWLQCLVPAVAGVLLLAGCTDNDHSRTFHSQAAGFYQGLIVQDDGGMAGVTGFFSGDGSANLSLTRPSFIPAGVSMGNYKQGSYDGVLARDGSGASENVQFQNQSGTAGQLRARIRAGGFAGQLRLQRDDSNKTNGRSLVGQYAFVDGGGKRWDVSVSSAGKLQASSGNCSFKGQMRDAQDDHGKPVSLELVSGQCCPFSGKSAATAYLRQEAVGSVNTLRVVFVGSDPDTHGETAYDWFWFPA